MAHRILLSFALSLAALHLAAQQPAPNIPDKFTNLQVLPPNITKPQLVGLMKQMAITMKVRCNFCHAVTDDLSSGDFSSDEKPTKLEARKLLRLIQQTAAPIQPPHE